MYNNAKDVKTEIDLCAFALNWKTITRKTQWCKEQKSPCVFHWNFRLCRGWIKKTRVMMCYLRRKNHEINTEIL
ncbi:MAG: hypothetical protein C5S47_05905 [Candidatus Methanogasteraceae archaeon]|nr:MAG: hypothetical protein C5S47_05905 [ANME-2 cluster archaeon]